MLTSGSCRDFIELGYFAVCSLRFLGLVECFVIKANGRVLELTEPLEITCKSSSLWAGTVA